MTTKGKTIDRGRRGPRFRAKALISVFAAAAAFAGGAQALAPAPAAAVIQVDYECSYWLSFECWEQNEGGGEEESYEAQVEELDNEIQEDTGLEEEEERAYDAKLAEAELRRRDREEDEAKLKEEAKKSREEEEEPQRDFEAMVQRLNEVESHCDDLLAQQKDTNGRLLPYVQCGERADAERRALGMRRRAFEGKWEPSSNEMALEYWKRKVPHPKHGKGTAKHGPDKVREHR